MQVTDKQYYSIEEYLALEEAADYKSEYIDGEIVPMAGGSTNHNQIAGNFYAELSFAFKKLDYRAFMSDVRLWIPQRRIYTYPDVMVVVREPEYYNNRTDTITNPRVIIEVLSPSTKGYDRSKKFEVYRTIPTFGEYLLIDQTRIYIEHFSKTDKKRWSFGEYNQSDEAIALASVSFEISIADIYNKVNFEQVDAETAPEVGKV
ncbi:Uma2 family endonuclease [Desertifilum sp. FACHB-1129]|uniref:Uma2 family endonuclease n=1 Tax=unclassified Desertifilum TaxID=2621682 RepID=UPI001687AE6C|nr:MULTISPECIES: Uma2 family endonuclease [unclassified Desertifilum]MBD2311091.1 Uma2 family endonuclease [Desertifilum sp. FACHB-1129]MBD2323958.1 Uma2 family endonuclease [Desertifilum sp. FACHB-866]MBD2333893.1 Uma2 family endonuclease [Desertifilum sp. FACHB-868]MDA0211204.1 Uma2 family endonuclease [Cyanobacteria bacterium FC1]